MTRRRLPRSLSFAPRPVLLTGADVVLLGWLGGGLLATAVATVTERPNDLAYGLVNTLAAVVGLLVRTAVRARDARRRGRRSQPARPGDPLPVPVPVQAAPAHDERREPALR